MKRSYFPIFVTVVCLASGFIPTKASGQEASGAKPASVVNSIWNGGTGNWSLATDWTPNGAPNNGANTYNVTIGTGNDLVNLDINATINSLTLGNGTGPSTLQNLSGHTQTLGITGLFTDNFGADFTFTNASVLTVGGGVNNAGIFDLDQGSKATITGNFTNSGLLETNRDNLLTSPNSFTLTGTLTNNPGGQIVLGNNNNTTDTMSLGTLVNNGYVLVGTGTTLTLGTGISDIPAGSELDILGSFKKGAGSALAGLGSVEGLLSIENNQTVTVTPGSGTLTISSAGIFDVDRTSTVTIAGAVNNSGAFYTNRNNYVGSNTVTVTGVFTNEANAVVVLGNNNNTTDVMNVGSLANSGNVIIGVGAALNLTGQPNGITDAVSGSQLSILGTFKAGTASGIAKLGSVEGQIAVENNQTTTITPGSGTLTISAPGVFDVDRSSNVTIAGAVNNAGTFYTNRNNYVGSNTVTVTGAFTNNSGASVVLGNNNNTSDVMSLGSLTNNGYFDIGIGATLNLTSQPNGITDAVAGSQLYDLGTFKAGAAFGLAKLASVEGIVSVENNQSNTITPTGGTLTVSSAGTFDVDRSSNVTISGAVSNSGHFYTNENNYVGSNTVTVTGAFTNTAAGTTVLGNNNNTSDVMNVGSLSNSGDLIIGEGATLNLTSQPNGITDAVAGSQLNILGTFKAGAASGIAKLASVEGSVALENNQSTTITPGGGTLTVSSTGFFDVDRSSNATISGAVNNSGQFYTNHNNYVGSNTVTVTGAFTNAASGFLVLGNNNNTSDVMNVGSLVNNGVADIDEGATLNLTAQPNGITDVVAGSQLNILGTFKAGTANGVAKLKSVEGLLALENNQSTTITPTGGTLTIASTGLFDVDRSSTVTISGAVSNSGQLITNQNNYVGSNTLTVAGTLTNTASGTVTVGNNNNTTDVLNAGILANSGTITVGENATLNLTTAGTDTTSGAINLNSSTLKISGSNVTLNGTGTVTLSSVTLGPGSNITGASASDTFTNGATIQGFGTISNMGIVNNGKIIANQSTPLVILPSTAGLTNNGTLSVLTGDTMQIGTATGGALTNFASNTLTGGTYSVGGTLQFGATGTSIVTDAANISLTGAGAKIVDFSGNNVLTNLATITSAGSLTFGTSYGTFTTAGNFTNNGTLSVGAGDKFVVNLADSLTNFSGTTLTGGTYKITGTFQFKGANIVTNAANITLSGANSKISGTGNANGLANFATNAAGASFTLGTGRSFTTAGNFTNNGLLTIGSGDTFDVNGSLSNFAGSTLTGGAYNVSGTLQFNGANIVTNAANITLGSSTAKIVNQSSANALLGFTTNTAAGKFTLSGNANLTTNGGSFTNAGLFTVSTGSTFTVGGSSFNFTQTAGTTTVDGTLSAASAGSLSLSGGSLFGSGTVNYGVVDSGVISPGDSVALTGKLGVTGTYSQTGTGALDMTIGGTTAGTKYDQLNITGTAALNGALNIALASGYTPAVGNTFDILNASSISGNFSTVTGLAINANEHFTVTVVGNDEIVLTVVSGPAPASSVTLTSLASPARAGQYGRQVYSGLHRVSLTTTPVIAPVVATVHTPVGMQNLRPRDEFSTPMAAPGASAPASMGGVTAPVSSPFAAMNHMRFECGVDVNALRKTSPKQLLKGLWAAPDSPNAVNIGYMTYTAR